MFSFHTPLQIPKIVQFGSIDPETQPPHRLYAFAMLEGNARVFTFHDTPDGREELAMLLRSEGVVCVVAGTEVVTTSESLLTIRTPAEPTYQDRHQFKS